MDNWDVYQIRFWSERENWPLDFGPGVFFARAVEAVGHEISSRWTGLEPIVAADEVAPPLGDASLLNATQRWCVARQLRAARLWTRADFGDTGPEYITPDELEAARRLAWQLRPQVEQHLERWRTAMGVLVAAIQDGSVATMLRAVDGGPYSEDLPAHVWWSEYLKPRIASCLLNRFEPFDNGPITHDFCWIYVDADALEGLLERIAQSSGAGGEGEGVEQEDAPLELMGPALGQSDPQPKAKRRGAPQKFDWAAYEEEFARRVEAMGFPSEENEKGWQRQKDVEDFLIKCAAREKPPLEMRERTARNGAAKLLGKFRQ